MPPCYPGCLTAQVSLQHPASSFQLASLQYSLVNTGKSWALYIVLRIVFFAVPFAVLLLINWPWWLALLISTLIALALSVIFLSRQRSEASTSIYEWRNRERTADDIAEDAIADEQAHEEGGESADSEPSR